jgi:1,4-alpha-glucan branching enzyme
LATATPLDAAQKTVWEYSIFSEVDVRNFQADTHYQLYDFFGNKQFEVNGVAGTYLSLIHI